MVLDYYIYDYENAEPPRVTSLQRNLPLATFVNFGEDMYFVADQRGYEIVVHDLAKKILKTNENGSIIDPRLKLGKVHSHCSHLFLLHVEKVSTWHLSFVISTIYTGPLAIASSTENYHVNQ